MVISSELTDIFIWDSCGCGKQVVVEAGHSSTLEYFYFFFPSFLWARCVKHCLAWFQVDDLVCLALRSDFFLTDCTL